MAERPISQYTLREMFTEAERLTRELVDHLDHGFTPCAHRLVRLVRPTETEAHPSDVEDITIRNQSAQLLESENFTEQVYQKLEAYSKAIDAAVSRIVTGT